MNSGHLQSFLAALNQQKQKWTEGTAARLDETGGVSTFTTPKQKAVDAKAALSACYRQENAVTLKSMQNKGAALGFRRAAKQDCVICHLNQRTCRYVFSPPDNLLLLWLSVQPDETELYFYMLLVSMQCLLSRPEDQRSSISDLTCCSQIHQLTPFNKTY